MNKVGIGELNYFLSTMCVALSYILVMNKVLLRGVRATKMDSGDYQA